VTVERVTFEVHATIEGLICAVERAVDEGLIRPELENSLLVKLYAARASRERGQVTPQLGQLRSFTHELASQRGKKIAATFTDRASGWTNDLIARVLAGEADGTNGKAIAA
jgi:hypothetical protein